MRQLVAIERLDAEPASTIKKNGWPETVERVRRAGALLITNHRRPEAVILSVDEYNLLVMRSGVKGASKAAPKKVGDELSLARLQSRFDQRMEAMKDGNKIGIAMGLSTRTGKKYALRKPR